MVKNMIKLAKEIIEGRRIKREDDLTEIGRAHV